MFVSNLSFIAHLRIIFVLYATGWKNYVKIFLQNLRLLKVPLMMKIKKLPKENVAHVAHVARLFMSEAFSSRNIICVCSSLLHYILLVFKKKKKGSKSLSKKTLEKMPLGDN